MSITERARRYEGAYHDELYANHDLFSPGTWLYKPAAYAVRSFARIPKRAHPSALDLGGGVGRHSIPLAQHLGVRSKVVCVDLLDSAISRLNINARKHGVEDNIVGIVSDVETYKFEQPYDYVLSISCIEHVPTKLRLKSLINRLQEATAPDGVHCFMMITDNVWVDSATKAHLTPLIEQNLTAEETIAMLNELYQGWQIHDLSTKNWQATQLIGEREVILESTCVQFTVQKQSEY